jgi:hypothetical protein
MLFKKEDRTLKQIIQTDAHIDQRPSLAAWEYGGGEVKELVITEDKVRLGNHAHRCGEMYIIAAGTCVIRTWSRRDGLNEVNLDAPAVVRVEPREEHLFICSKGTILIGIVPQKFNEKGMIPATHLE